VNTSVVEVKTITANKTELQYIKKVSSQTSLLCCCGR